MIKLLTILILVITVMACNKKEPKKQESKKQVDKTVSSNIKKEIKKENVAPIKKKEAITEKDLAKLYFNSLILGDIDKLKGILALPFSLDKKEIVKDMKVLIKKHEKMIKKVSKIKGKVKIVRIEKNKSPIKLPEDLFKDYSVMRVIFTVKKNKEVSLDVYIKTDKYGLKVIGMND